MQAGTRSKDSLDNFIGTSGQVLSSILESSQRLPKTCFGTIEEEFLEATYEVPLMYGDGGFFVRGQMSRGQGSMSLKTYSHNGVLDFGTYKKKECEEKEKFRFPCHTVQHDERRFTTLCQRVCTLPGHIICNSVVE